MYRRYTDSGDEEEYSGPVPPHSRLREENQRDRFFVLRNVLNIIWMLGVVAGIGVYMKGNTFIGGWILAVSIVIKLVEVSVRMIRF
ncbi:hypothetical protein [Xylanibacter muris]|uniref:Uncharacterized protein n=1 Tax=Xylanibacter muris TaxID=2736290 RepID=A0ABX2AKG8_9BACT|nr:hypothetical protein [Xylanibacter muris]NPD91245.1 hypothetical protein [Xylanibacter muris]